MEDYNEHKVYKNSNGSIFSEYYYLNGKFHRISGPAAINYHENGNISCEQYYLNDILHRLDGPAWIEYNNNGAIICKIHSLLDCEISKKDFYTPGFIDAFILDRS